ncbi:glutamate-5-semialdehyde dehydrogenase [Desulfothermus okinawensis JCM 13304]
MSNIRDLVLDIAKRAKMASKLMANASTEKKNKALMLLADMLESEKTYIQEENRKDLELAEQKGLGSAKIDRLTLSDKVIESMRKGCLEVASLPDPVGAIESMWKRPNGLLVGKMRIPLGVIGMIYESRPNVTIDAGILCIKASNAVILRGGSEAFYSNQVLAKLFSKALSQVDLPKDAVQLIPTTDREAVTEMLKLDEYIDVIIPRGGEGLIRAVVDGARMPVLKHYKGVCHIYVDQDVDVNQAVEIIYNAKVQRPGVCNALECLLVHEKVAPILLPKVGEKLGGAGVLFKADKKSYNYLEKWAEEARSEDFGYEFLELKMAVKVVASQDEAQEHIMKYGSNHTEAILTNNHQRAMKFLKEVDASLVLVNASTRFNDGGELGLGAEIGISTSKLHAYGPMGVKELTSTKFVAFGEGQVRI